jgi:hypothetical protein
MGGSPFSRTRCITSLPSAHLIDVRDHTQPVEHSAMQCQTSGCTSGQDAPTCRGVCSCAVHLFHTVQRVGGRTMKARRWTLAACQSARSGGGERELALGRSSTHPLHHVASVALDNLVDVFPIQKRLLHVLQRPCLGLGGPCNRSPRNLGGEL